MRAWRTFFPATSTGLARYALYRPRLWCGAGMGRLIERRPRLSGIAPGLAWCYSAKCSR